MRRLSRAALVAAGISLLLAGCASYHGPVTNAPEGDREIGKPVGPDET